MLEFLNSVTESVKTRLKSQIFGTFVLSWVGWNWKIFYISFFVDSEELTKICGMNKLQYIEYLKLINIESNLRQPILWTIIFVFGFPILRAINDLYEKFVLYIKNFVDKNLLDKKGYVKATEKIRLTNQLKILEEKYNDSYELIKEKDILIENNNKNIQKFETDLKSNMKEYNNVLSDKELLVRTFNPLLNIFLGNWTAQFKGYSAGLTFTSPYTCMYYEKHFNFKSLNIQNEGPNKELDLRITPPNSSTEYIFKLNLINDIYKGTLKTGPNEPVDVTLIRTDKGMFIHK